METQIQNNLDHWLQQWLAIEHPKDISLKKKIEEYRTWRNVWDIWYTAPNLELSQVILAYNESKK